MPLLLPTVPGQIPAGASAWVISGGLNRDFSGNNSLLGNFSEFRGGVARRLGVSETLTLGFGGVYDESLRGLAELFYRPKNIPLRIAVSALAGDGVDVISDIRYEPSNLEGLQSGEYELEINGKSAGELKLEV